MLQELSFSAAARHVRVDLTFIHFMLNVHVHLSQQLISKDLYKCLYDYITFMIMCIFLCIYNYIYMYVCDTL